MLAIVLVVGAGVVIWRTGIGGKLSGTVALLVSLLLIAWPVSYLLAYYGQAKLNDVSTDIRVPPKFVTIGGVRRAGANPVAFQKERAERVQAASYPDIRSINVDRSSEEVFELALTVLNRFGVHVIAERAPDMASGAPGWIEGVDRTLVMGFYDDVVVRIAGDRRRARFDVRSASRYGQHDFWTQCRAGAGASPGLQ